MRIKITSFDLAPGDQLKHPISATPVRAAYFCIYPKDGSGIIYVGDAANQQAPVPPYQFPPRPDMAPIYYLDEIYYKLTADADHIVGFYATLENP